MMRQIIFIGIVIFFLNACKKGGGDIDEPNPPATAIAFTAAKINSTNASLGFVNYNTPVNTVLRLQFNNKVNRATVAPAVSLMQDAVGAVPFSISYENGDSTVVLNSANPFTYLSTIYLSFKIYRKWNHSIKSRKWKAINNRF